MANYNKALSGRLRVMSYMTLPLYLSAMDVAEVLGVSQQAVSKAVTDGIFPRSVTVMRNTQRFYKWSILLWAEGFTVEELSKMSPIEQEMMALELFGAYDNLTRSFNKFCSMLAQKLEDTYDDDIHEDDGKALGEEESVAED